MKNFLQFVTDLPHPSIAGGVRPADMFLPAQDITTVEDIYENGTGKPGVQIVASNEAGAYARLVLLGYKAVDVVIAAHTAIGRNDTYLVVPRTAEPRIIS